MKTLITNGTIYIEQGHYEEALLIEDGIIKMAGKNSDVRLSAGLCDKKIDCQGRVVIPGLNDDHCHPLLTAAYSLKLDLTKAHSIDEIIRCGRAFIKTNPGAKNGVYGYGWNVNFFTQGEKRDLNRHDLDQISTTVPVIFQRACAHMAACNTKAIEMTGCGRNAQITGGVIGLEEDGCPNGQFAENAQDLLTRLLKEPAWPELEAAFAALLKHAARCGITSVNGNDPGLIKTPAEVYRFLHNYYKEGRLTYRYHTQNYYPTAEGFKEYLYGEYAHGEYDDYLSKGPLKMFRDGTIGARSALLDRDYEDDPGNRGTATAAEEQLFLLARLAADHGIQLITHCIGNQAISDVVDIYEKVMPEGGNRCRNVINHCQLMTLPLIERMGRLGILAACQPIFLNSDLHSLETRISKEFARTSNAYRTMLRLLPSLAFGTDAPIEDSNPFPSLYCAVTRKDLEGRPEQGYFPEERLNVEEAVDCYTLGSAYQQFMEDRKGRLKPGCFADLAILDQNLFTIDPDAVKDVKSVLTMVDGRIVYHDESGFAY